MRGRGGGSLPWGAGLCRPPPEEKGGTLHTGAPGGDPHPHTEHTGPDGRSGVKPSPRHPYPYPAQRWVLPAPQVLVIWLWTG